MRSMPLWTLLVGGALMVGPRPTVAWAQQVEPKVIVLDNGLELLLVERHEQPTVACGVFYDVGSVNDPQGRSGIAHMFEHMLFKGTRIIGTSDYEKERPLIEEQDRLREQMIAEMNKMRLAKRRGKISDVLDPGQWTQPYTEMKKRYDALVEEQRQYVKNNELANLYGTNGGVGMNAGTAEDLTLYFVQLPANKLELFFWLESDRMANGVMREFYVERDNVREERRLRTESTPTGKFDEGFEALFWQSHPYGIPVVGWPSEVESITRDDVRNFYKIYYAPNNARISLVGDFDSAEVAELAERYFGPIPRGPSEPPPVITEEPKPLAERRFYAEAETNPRVRIRFHGVAIGHADEAALEVLAGLVSGKTGRLYKRLVTAEDAVIGRPRGSNNSRKYAGYFTLAATVKEGRRPEEVEQLLLEEIDKLREGEISDHELQKVKNQVLAGSVRRLKNNMGLMMQLGFYDVWYDWTYINESSELMLAVTADDVRRAVNKYFDPKTRTVAIYRTKKSDTPGESAEVEDPELTALLESLPAEAHGQIKGMVKQIEQATDLAALRQQLLMMQQMAGSAEMPEAQKPVFEYALKKIEARVAELEAADKESD